MRCDQLSRLGQHSELQPTSSPATQSLLIQETLYFLVEKVDVDFQLKSQTGLDTPSLPEEGGKGRVGEWQPDEADIIAGSSWHHTIGQQIATAKSAAVFVGQHGIGPWQYRETTFEASGFGPERIQPQSQFGAEHLSKKTCFGPTEHINGCIIWTRFLSSSVNTACDSSPNTSIGLEHFRRAPILSRFATDSFEMGRFAHMLIAGNEGSCRAFLEWGAAAIKPLASRVADIAKKKWGSEPILDHEFLPARFTLEGEIEGTEWPNFQIDCYGTFLWLVTEYIRRSGRKVSPQVEETVNLIVEYLELVWTFSCFDPWEEHRHERHTASLACVYGGLSAAGALFGKSDWIELAGKVKEALNRSGDRYYPKYLSGGGIDANAMWLAFPYGVVEYDDARFQCTLDEIKLRLLRPLDTFSLEPKKLQMDPVISKAP